MKRGVPEHLDNGERVTEDEEFGLISIFCVFPEHLFFQRDPKGKSKVVWVGSFRNLDSNLNRRRRSGASINQEGGNQLPPHKDLPDFSSSFFFY